MAETSRKAAITRKTARFRDLIETTYAAVSNREVSPGGITSVPDMTRQLVSVTASRRTSALDLLHEDVSIV